jgi:hypothetical protein
VSGGSEGQIPISSVRFGNRPLRLQMFEHLVLYASQIAPHRVRPQVCVVGAGVSRSCEIGPVFGTDVSARDIEKLRRVVN